MHKRPKFRRWQTVMVVARVLVCSHAGPSSLADARQASQEEKKTAEDSRPDVILSQVYEKSLAVAADQRAFLLLDLADAWLTIDREHAAKYAKELFDLSQQLPLDWYNYRSASQFNGVRILAAAGKPRQAAELLERMEAPQLLAGGEMADSMDLREAALEILLPKVLLADRETGLAWGVRLLRRFGAGGPYPYGAAQTVIQELLSDDPIQAESVYTEAVSQFGKDIRLSRTRRSFVEFLLAFGGKFQPGLERAAVLAAVDDLLEAPVPEKQLTLARLTLENDQTLTLNNRNDLLLYRLLPLLARHAPQRAEKLLQQRNHLGTALEEGGGIQNQQAIVVIGEHDDSPDHLDAVARRSLAWQQARRIGEVAAKDPDKALGMAEGMDAEAPRAAALALAAAAVATEDPKRARTLLERSLFLLDKVEDPPERLKLLTYILRAYSRMEDTKHAGDTYQAILDLGGELLEQEIASDPQVPLFVTGSYGQLSQATQYAVGIAADASLLQLSTLDNEVLRMHLMIQTARAIVSSQRQ